MFVGMLLVAASFWLSIFKTIYMRLIPNVATCCHGQCSCVITPSTYYVSVYTMSVMHQAIASMSGKWLRNSVVSLQVLASHDA